MGKKYITDEPVGGVQGDDRLLNQVSYTVPNSQKRFQLKVIREARINQNHWEILLNTHWSGYKTVTSVSKNVEKMELSYTTGRNVK